MEIKIKIEATGLEKAILALAGALQGVQTLPVAEATPQAETVKKKETPVKEATKTKAEEAPKETKADEAKRVMEEGFKEAEEKAEAATGLTFEQVRIKLAEVSQKGKQKELKALITSLGAEKLSDIPEAQYAELLEKASEL